MNDLPERGVTAETEECVYFYISSYSVLDNTSAHQVKIWDKMFPTAEHAYQWKKYAESHPHVAERVPLALSPYEVKQISDAYKKEVSSAFLSSKIAVMEEILRAKYAQHKDVEDALTRSGNKNIMENSPTDSFWGIGADGQGENVIGVLWMKIRKEYSNT